MKAALLKKVGEPFVIEDVPVPEIGPDEVLVATRTCGMYRTDTHIQDGLAYVPNLPHILGHEPAGMLSVIIPACNEADYICPCLEALLAKTIVGPVEIIVAANACTDETVAIARGLADRVGARGWTLVVLDIAEGGHA